MINDILVKNITDMIDAKKQKILWSNSDPTESIAAGDQAILNSSDYDYLIWIYCYNTKALFV